MKNFDYIGIGFCSNDHLAVLPFIPMDTKVRMLSHRIMGGGPAANSTAGAASLGLSAAFVGTVGDDADGDMILRDFHAQGVDTSMVKVRPGATSAIAYLWIEEKTGNRSCAWTREGLDELTADEINPEAIAAAKILHVDGHNAAGAIAAAKVAREAGVLVNYDAGTHRDGMEELLGLADLMICSEEGVGEVPPEGLRRHDGRARLDGVQRKGFRALPRVQGGEGGGHHGLRRPLPHGLRGPLDRDARHARVHALRERRLGHQVPRPLRPPPQRADTGRGGGILVKC